MRIISGVARGRRLETLDGEDVRPTADRVKEAIFSMVQFKVEGCTVLDLFAGSGQLGIEALSRGAIMTHFVDQSDKSCQVIKKNLQSTGLEEHARVTRMGAESFILSAIDRYKFDIILLDPPYGEGHLQKILTIIDSNGALLLSPDAEIICEHESSLDIGGDFKNISLMRKYKYGRVAVSRYGVLNN